jgi:dephospho-CoA kinase
VSDSTRGSKTLTRVRAKRIKPIIGLTGGIGAGKSSVARILQSLGAAVIDSDRIAHEELSDLEVIATLRAWWGDKVCPSKAGVDRKALASIVFNDPAELDRLEKLLYPRIHRRREQLVAGYQADPAVRAIVLDAPKLYEAGLGDYCDAVIFVEADRSVRVRRVAASRGWTEDELRRRENLQNLLDTKRANADHVVINHANLDQLRTEVERVFASVLAADA